MRPARYLSSTVTDPRIRAALAGGERKHGPGLLVAPLPAGRRPLGGRRTAQRPAAATARTVRSQTQVSADRTLTPRSAVREAAAERRVLDFAERLARTLP